MTHKPDFRAEFSAASLKPFDFESAIPQHFHFRAEFSAASLKQDGRHR